MTTLSVPSFRPKSPQWLAQFLSMYLGFLQRVVVVLSTGPEGEDGRMRGRGEVWILQLVCNTSRIFGPSVYCPKINEISCAAALLGGVNCEDVGCVYHFPSVLNNWLHLFLWKLPSLGHTGAWLCFSWACLFPHEVPAFMFFQLKKRTKKEKELERQKKEKELCKLEAALMDPSRQPQSADDFDRLVLSSPNSSILWLQYMAFHLQATEIEKARAVAERALKTICFR